MSKKPTLKEQMESLAVAKIEITEQEKAAAYESTMYELFKTNPYYGGLLQEIRIYYNDQAVPTAGFAFEKGTGRPYIVLNSKFFCHLPLPNRVSLLMHEILHFTHGHWMRMFKNSKAKDLKGQIKNHLEHTKNNIACLPAGELVNGVNKSIEDVEIGDSVLGHTGVTTVVNKMSRFYKGHIYTIKASGCLPIKITDEHPLLISNRKWRTHYPITLESPKWVKASEVEEKYNYLCIPKIKDLSDYLELDLSPFIEKQGRNILTSLKLDEDLAFIMGLYVAEGSKTRRNNGGIQFSLSSKEKSLLTILHAYFSRLGYKPNISVSESRSNAIISSPILAKAFEKWFGRGAKNKVIPDFILKNSNVEIVRAFLEGLVEGDGCVQPDKKSFRLNTISKILALQTQLLCMRLGTFANLREYVQPERTIRGRTIKPSTIYELAVFSNIQSEREMRGVFITSTSSRWKETEEYFLVPITKITTTPFAGMVYNIETESHSFCSNNIITHNCDMSINQYLNPLPAPGAIDVANFKLKDGTPFPKYKTAEIYRKLLDDNQEANQEQMEKYIPTDSHDLVDWDELSEEEKEQILEEAKNTLKRAKEKASTGYSKADKHAEDLLEAIENETQKSNAKSILSMAIKRTISNPNRRYTWTRPNKRYGVYAPGSADAKAPQVGIFLDYSGSISQGEITDFLTVLNDLLQAGSKQCWLGLWHTEMFYYEKYKMNEDFNAIPKQTGGTDVQCVMATIDEKKLDIAIVLTDGYYSEAVPSRNKNVVYVISKGGDINHPMAKHSLATIALEKLTS